MVATDSMFESCWNLLVILVLREMILHVLFLESMLGKTVFLSPFSNEYCQCWVWQNSDFLLDTVGVKECGEGSALGSIPQWEKSCCSQAWRHRPQLFIYLKIPPQLVMK